MSRIDVQIKFVLALCQKPLSFVELTGLGGQSSLFASALINPTDLIHPILADS
ncbi:MAG: hypothetical protein P8N76_00010 [Pirellulaceae bacterium]|nr:hypothetical protein [Pirellulaceae bacterium]